MKVISRNETKEADYPKRIICDHCGAELEYDKDDEFIGQWGIRAVCCPECMKDVFVSDHRIESPNWKATFDHINSATAKELKNEEIQEYIDNCYKFLMNEAKPGDSYMTGSGDTMVFGFRYEDTVDLYVTRDYYKDITCL